MAILNAITEIEEGEIIEEPRKVPSKLTVELPWKKADRQVSPARDARLRAQPYPHTYTRPLSPGLRPAPKYHQPSGYEPQTAQQLKVCLDQFMFEWRQKQTSKEIPMRADAYARAVQRLRSYPVRRRVGKGTLEDPEIMWISTPDDTPRGRVAGIEMTCRHACYKMGTTKLWIRKYDHGTTRTFTRTAYGRTEKTISQDDPHITVYMGDSFHYLYEGHVYCTYTNSYPHLPAGLAKPEERRFSRDGNTDPVPVLNREEVRQRAYDIGLLQDPRRRSTAPNFRDTTHLRVAAGSSSHSDKNEASSSTASRKDTWRKSNTDNSATANDRDTCRRSNTDTELVETKA